MTEGLSLGYVPLLDAAPLIIAKALGFAEEEGLHLVLHPAPSWASLRDMLAHGQVDAAHMLAPLPIAMALGPIRGDARFEVLSVLNINGNVIGTSQALAQRLVDGGHDFAFNHARMAGQALLAASDTLRIGVPYGFSMHAELIHYWLGALGADAARLDIRTVPPPRMADALALGEIDAFCVGEPWGSVAADSGAGSLLLPTAAIWARAPEKVLATRFGWADAQPEMAGRLLRALWRAGQWLGREGNGMMAAELLAAPDRLAVPPEVIERALTGRMVISPAGLVRHGPPLIDFFGGAATFPWRSQAAWIGAHLARRIGFDPIMAAQTAAPVFRSDLYRLHLRDTGACIPGASEKLEGALATPTVALTERGKLILPPDRFFDARIFDPHRPER